MLAQEIQDTFAGLVMEWQVEHGRHGLPWQHTRDPYHVWLSEVMLQQTQVSTVLRYYSPFLARFPDVRSLAVADVDDVMQYWSGLGYYSRAKNLHRCAQRVVNEFEGIFPLKAETLMTLPGIGKSTAAAIAAFCAGERVAILDANVRRVLTRFLGFKLDLSASANIDLLWAQAENLLPRNDLTLQMPCYTQGLMDLGSGVCTSRRPQCQICPLQKLCCAFKENAVQNYPVRTKKLKRKAQIWWLLFCIRPDGAVWLQRRPDGGIWAQLYAPLVQNSYSAIEQLLSKCNDKHVTNVLTLLEPRMHVLTHLDLHLHPVLAHVDADWGGQEQGCWLHTEEAFCLGLPAPVRRLLEEIFQQHAEKVTLVSKTVEDVLHSSD